MTVLQALRLLTALLGLLFLQSCRLVPVAVQPEGPRAAYLAPTPDLEHDVYIATDRDLTLYRAVETGLVKVRTATQSQDATVGLGVSRQCVFLWRDGDWFSYSPELEPINHLPLGHRYTYAEYHVASSPSAILADLSLQVATIGPDLKVGHHIPIPGIADDIIINANVAYILDPTMKSHYLVRADLSDPDKPEVIDQVKFYEGPQSKGAHWLDLERSQWLVLMQRELLVFELADLKKPPLRVPCRNGFDMRRLEGGGPFRIWKAVDQTPLWALGHDTGLAVAHLERTSEGLTVARRLDLTPSATPLMSPPFIKRAGSRLYASDGGDLWIIDITGAGPRLIDVMKFRYGLHLVAVPRRR